MTNNQPAVSNCAERKVYSQPRLEVFGDLRALTQNTGLKTKPDSTVSRTAGTRAV